MQDANTNLFARPDTFLGVCEGLGEDLRINAFFLRIAFAGFLFWNPVAAIATYLAAGIFIMVLRWFVPNPATAPAKPEADVEEFALAA